jgi:hypothetical protein
MLYGAVVECIATCMCRVASKALSDMNPNYGPAIDSFIGTSLVVAGKCTSPPPRAPLDAHPLGLDVHHNWHASRIPIHPRQGSEASSTDISERLSESS